MADYEQILKTMTGRFTELSGIEPNAASDIGIRLKVLAAQIFSLTAELEGLKGQLYPTTAQGEKLDLHAQMRGLTRKQATPATGVLRFSRQSPAACDIVIPAGTRCQTEQDSVQCETTADGILKTGELAAEVPAQTIETGERANVAAGRVTVFACAVSGVYAVTNPTPFTGGCEAEDDDTLRARLLESYRVISNGTNTAFYYNEAMKYPFVHSARVLPRVRGIGTVDVLAAGRGAAPSAEQLAVIQADLAAQKDICVDVRVLPPVLKPTDVTLEVRVRDEYGFESIRQRLTVLITEFFSERQVGAPLYAAELSGRVFGCDGVVNHRLILPSSDIAAADDTLITLGTLTIQRL